MTPFDDQFADRVREAFDAYEEPVDEAALARIRAALGPTSAPDRGPVAGRARRWRWTVVATCAALLIAGALWARWPSAPAEPVRVAVAQRADTRPIAQPEPSLNSDLPRDRAKLPAGMPPELAPIPSVTRAPLTVVPLDPQRRRPGVTCPP